MAQYKNSYLAALLNDGTNQILPLSKDSLIELSLETGFKAKFGDNANSVKDALSYLVDFANTNKTAIETANTDFETTISNLSATYTAEQGKVFTSISQTDGQLVDPVYSYLNTEDIKRTATTENEQAGTHRIDSTNMEAALHELVGMINAGGSGSVVTVEKQATAEDNYAATYIVKQGGSQVGVKINIPKDFLVKSGEVKTATATDVTNELYTGITEGEKYLDFVVNTAADGDGTAETDQHIYIPVNDLVDVYTGGTWTSGNYSTTVAKDNNNQFTVSLNSNITDALALAETAIQASNLAAIATSGNASDATVTRASGTELSKLTNATTDTNAQTALESIASYINTLANVDYVHTVKGDTATVNDGVSIGITPTTDQTGNVTLGISHSLGNVATLHYDSKSTNDGISETFFNSNVNNS